MLNIREHKRIYRHERLRKVVVGTSERPRLCVHRSLNHLYVQVIDDSTGKVLLGKSTQAKDLKSAFKSGGNVQAASVFGEKFAKEAVNKGIKKVCFDRCGYAYHGRIKAFAEAVRKGGLEF